MQRRMRASLKRLRGVRGMTLVEVMVAAFLLIIVFFGLAQFYHRGRRQLDFEEDRRKATAVGEMRLDGLRRDFHYDALPGENNTDTTFVVDGDNFTVHHTITPGVPETNATTVTLDINWIARLNGTNVPRTMHVTTLLGRGMP
jgi:Tfp pilus assembly protein PilV